MVANSDQIRPSSPYYSDDSVTLWHGDSLTVLRDLPSGSVDCCVTSPPYFGLRDYGVDGQLGAESSPAEYVENMRALFTEVRRVLADDGTLWLNLGDTYSSQGGGKAAGQYADIRPSGGTWQAKRKPVEGIPAKNLLGIPWRVAFALQDDGWILRNSIIWAKPNAMPESVTDRLSTRHENVFMFSKRARYWFDLDPIREDQSPVSIARAGRADMRGKDGWADAYHGNPPTGLARQSARDTSIGRNPGDVWMIATQPFSAAHFAVYPVALPERCILAGCKPKVCTTCGHAPEPVYIDPDARPSERALVGWTDCGHSSYAGGTVLDPFSGSGTTGLAAAKHGRRYVGIDLNAEYLDLSLRTRLAQPGLDFEGGVA